MAREQGVIETAAETTTQYTLTMSETNAIKQALQLKIDSLIRANNKDKATPVYSARQTLIEQLLALKYKFH